MGILSQENPEIQGLKCVNRLDKQTSGVVFLGKNEKAANEFREAMQGDKVEKEYYARIQGDFREIREVTCRKWVYMKDYKRMLHDCEEEDKLNDEQRKTAKNAETKFVFENYDQESDTSVVRCYPKTGRTH